MKKLPYSPIFKGTLERFLFNLLFQGRQFLLNLISLADETNAAHHAIVLCSNII